MNKFGWFMCGAFIVGIGIDILLNYFNIGSMTDRVLIYILSIIGIALVILTQRDEISPEEKLRKAERKTNKTLKSVLGHR